MVIYDKNTLDTDVAKAFDRVDLKLLCRKLHRLEIYDNLLLEPYLLNRTLVVTIHVYVSIPFQPLSNFPQGSNLGPLLYKLFNNNLLGLISSECHAYADINMF